MDKTIDLQVISDSHWMIFILVEVRLKTFDLIHKRLMKIRWEHVILVCLRGMKGYLGRGNAKRLGV